METKVDEHHGKGGSYALDRETGQRTLIHRTQPKPAATAAAQNSTDASNTPQSGEGAAPALDPGPGIAADVSTEQAD